MQIMHINAIKLTFDAVCVILSLIVVVEVVQLVVKVNNGDAILTKQ